MKQFHSLLGSCVESVHEFVMEVPRYIGSGTTAAFSWAKGNLVGIGTLLLALATFMVALESHRQIGVLQLDQRPWVSAEPTAERVWMSDWNGTKGIGIVVWFKLHNYGRLPAQGVRINTMIAPRPDNTRLGELDSPEEKLCTEAASNSQPTITTVFPGHDASDSTNISTSGVYRDQKSVLWEVYGCIDYLYSSGFHGQTLFRYILGKIKGPIWSGLPFVMGPPIATSPLGPLRYVKLHKAQFDFRVDDSGGNYIR